MIAIVGSGGLSSGLQAGAVTDVIVSSGGGTSMGGSGVVIG